MKELDQGTIVYGCRSPQYPDLRCYGIIITARCDIANDKVAKLYYLIGVDANEWISSRLAYCQAYEQNYASKIKEFEDKVKKMTKGKDALNAETLLKMSDETAVCVLDSLNIAKQKDRDLLMESFRILRVYQKAHKSDCSGDRRALIKELPNPAIAYLQKIGSGKFVHFYYLPQAAYLKNSEMKKGLIVDFQEIESISMEDAVQIVTPGIDHRLLADYSSDQEKRYRQKFWLEHEDDFVAVEGAIQPTWLEHFMQRFSHAFTRIGIDGPVNHDFKALIENL